jgi:hypothetical protein
MHASAFILHLQGYRTCTYSLPPRPNSWTKSRQKPALIIFLLAIQSHLYGFTLRFIFLQTHATSYSFYGELPRYCTLYRRKEEKPPSLWFKKSMQNLKSENSQDYAQKPLRNCTFMNSASVRNGNM